MKPSPVKIIQVIAQGNSIMGLGDDGNLYRYDAPNNSWGNP